jgi:UDP-N-acetylglucosamine transferase subunit ALG13
MIKMAIDINFGSAVFLNEFFYALLNHLIVQICLGISYRNMAYLLYVFFYGQLNELIERISFHISHTGTVSRLNVFFDELLDYLL